MKFSAKDWLSLLGAMIVAVAGITVFAYSTFETKESAQSYQSKEAAQAFNTSVMDRLNRIEGKLDRLVFRLTDRRNENGRN